MSDTGPLPTFLIIGAQKSGTRWLRSTLGQHPDIYTVSEELWFFNDVGDRYAKRGVPWYRRQFADWSGETAIGESTPGYMMWKHEPAVVAERIGDVIPDARLLAVLRNPVDRAQSALVHHIKHGRFPADAELLDIIRSEPPETEMKNLIAGGWYAASLRPFVDRFGDRLLVRLNDDIRDDAGAVYDDAVRHVGLEPGFRPKGLEEVRFSNQPATKRSGGGLTPEQRLKLYEYFRDDVAELETMLGRDLSMWDPNQALATTSRRRGRA